MADNGGRIALHCTARNGRWDVIQRLNETWACADIDVADKYGLRVLHWAAMYGDLDVVKWLDEKGALAAINHQICFTPTYFTTSLHNLLLRANIDPTGFTKHSLRRGAAQSAADAGLSKEEIQTRGRWKSDSVFAYLTSATVAAMKPRTRALHRQ